MAGFGKFGNIHILTVKEDIKQRGDSVSFIPSKVMIKEIALKSKCIMKRTKFTKEMLTLNWIITKIIINNHNYLVRKQVNFSQLALLSI